MAMNVFVEADLWTVARTDQGNALLIRPRGSELAVPIFIGSLEAQSILIGLGNVEAPRPLTHDLICSLLRRLNLEPTRVEINDLKEGTFYSRIYVGKGEQEIRLDARPSDALAIMVRTHCPLYIAEDIVDQAGISIHLVPDVDQSVPDALSLLPKNFTEDWTEFIKQAIGSAPELGQGSERELLQKRLNLAVADENYEEAAKIRDQLKKLDERENT